MSIIIQGNLLKKVICPNIHDSRGIHIHKYDLPSLPFLIPERQQVLFLYTGLLQLYNCGQDAHR